MTSQADHPALRDEPARAGSLARVLLTLHLAGLTLLVAHLSASAGTVPASLAAWASGVGAQVPPGPWLPPLLLGLAVTIVVWLVTPPAPDTGRRRT